MTDAGIKQKVGKVILSNAVRYYTIRSFKGLEADIVFLTGVRAGSQACTPGDVYVGSSRALVYDKIIDSGGEVMTVYNDLKLTSLQKEALAELKTELIRRFDPEKLIIFGSTARGDFDDESDIDLLVITKWLYSRSERHQITDMVFEVNLKYGTNISSTVVDHQSWSYGTFSVLPIKQEIDRDGIAI